MLGGVAMVIMTTVSFYLITVYTPTFGSRVLNLTESNALLVTIAVAASNFIWLPISGAMSDRIGRKPILLAFAVLGLLTAYPTLDWLVRTPTFDRMLTVELWLSFVYACYNGAMVVALTEVIPASVRTSGFSLAYSLATTLGGSSLLISTWLIQHTGDKAAPGYWMSFAALVRPDRDACALSPAGEPDPVSRAWRCRRLNLGSTPRPSARLPFATQNGPLARFSGSAPGRGQRRRQNRRSSRCTRPGSLMRSMESLQRKLTCLTWSSPSRSNARSR